MDVANPILADPTPVVDGFPESTTVSGNGLAWNEDGVDCCALQP